MQGSRIKMATLALAAVAAMTATAFAQDYTTTIVSGQYTAPPATGVTTLTFANADDGQSSETLPFSFPYFGKAYSACSVGTNGYIQLGGGTSTSLSNVALPINGGTNDGILAVLWQDLNPRSAGSVKTWTLGTAPNRKFVVSWEGVPRYGGTLNMTLQVQLFETTGRIVMAYGSQTTWDANDYTTGIDAVSPDGRSVYHPNKTGANNSGKPADCQFDPVITNFTGRVLFDEVLSDSSGIGNSVNTDVVPTGLTVELRSGGNTTGSGEVDENGDFNIRGIALVSSDTGEAVLVASSAATAVSASIDTSNIGPADGMTIASNVSFAADAALGTVRITDANDSDRSARAAIQIALQMSKIHTWVTDRTDDELPQIFTFYTNGGSTAQGTSYSAGGGEVPPYIRIGGAASGNQDAFDSAVISRIYARHVLNQINAIASRTYDADVNTSNSEIDAFTDAFGHYLYAMTSGLSEAFDGTSASATTVFDMETPDLSASPSPRVSGWGAAALFDLIDAANETHDVIDGTTATDAEIPFAIVDALTEPVDPPTFLDEWINQGHDGPSLVKNFIRHGLLPDDVNEPNDTAGTAVDLGPAGVRSSDNTLNRYNEDWFEVLVPGPTSAFIVEVGYDRFQYESDITLQVRTPGGSIIATGSPDGTNGPIRAITGPLAAGTVLIRVAHNSGDAIKGYTIQAYSRVVVTTEGAPEWTVRRTINQLIRIEGGIPPYSLSVKIGTALPRGMILDESNRRLIGSPLDVGTFTFTIIANDDGEPTHSGSVTPAFKINEQLSFSAPDLTGVALNRATAVNLGRVGGTDPIDVSDLVGTLPDGLSISEDFEISGTATQPGGGDISFSATDAAGSAATMETTLVVCTPITRKNEKLPFAGGDAASGYYFDALGGGTVNLTIKTSKKREKRLYDVLVLGPDGAIVDTSTAVVKVKRGTIVMKKVPTPTTGRYFVAFSSGDGGAETELLGTLKTALPKKGGSAIERMELGSSYSFEFSALAGARFSLKGKTTDGMEISVPFIVQPDGTPISPTDIKVVNKNGKVSISAPPLTQDGTYQVRLAPNKTDLADLSYVFKIKQPKGGTFSLEE